MFAYHHPAAQSKKMEEAADALSETLLPEFQKRIAFDPEDITNQYALDFDAYIKWKTIASLLPQANDRVLFQKSVGDFVLKSLDADIEPYDARSEGAPIRHVSARSSISALSIAYARSRMTHSRTFWLSPAA